MKRILFLILTLFPCFIISTKVNNIQFLLTNWILAAITIFRLCFPSKSQRQVGIVAFNSNTMFYLFSYFFLVIAPLYQFVEKVNIWGGVPLTTDDYIKANIIFTFSIIVYDITYNILCRCQPILPKANSYDNEFRKYVAITISVLSLLFTLYVFRNAPVLLFLREINAGGNEILLARQSLGNSSIDLIYIIFIRPIPIMVLIFANYHYRNEHRFFRSVLFIIALVSNFPLSLSRFYVAAIYIPLLISYFPTLIKREFSMKLVMIVGIMYIFPFLNQGRQVEGFDEITLCLEPNYEMFRQGHFDSYSNAARVFSHETITYGKQLLGAIFFFIPRSIWPTKAIGSGGYIADLYNLNFSNISLNYFGEGFINFGYIGIIIFAIFISKLNIYFDTVFVKSRVGSYKYVAYLIYLGTMIFFLRGDLISSIAYLIGLLSSAFFVQQLIFSKTNENYS